MFKSYQLTYFNPMQHINFLGKTIPIKKFIQLILISIQSKIIFIPVKKFLIFINHVW